MCAAGVAFEPKYKSERKWLTKVITFVPVIDDVYDIYTSFEELKPFTMAFERFVYLQDRARLLIYTLCCTQSRFGILEKNILI